MATGSDSEEWDHIGETVPHLLRSVKIPLIPRGLFRVYESAVVVVLTEERASSRGSDASEQLGMRHRSDDIV